MHVAQGGSQRTGGTQQAQGLCYVIASLSCHQPCSALSLDMEAASRQDVSPSVWEVTCREGCSQLSSPGPIYTRNCESLSHFQLFEPCRLLCPCNFPDKNTGVGSHSLLHGTFLTQVSQPELLNCRQILYHLSHQGSPGRQGDKSNSLERFGALCQSH
ncbi:unnamed protein product [Rangifer tarandus platyrhynchus]|uniref:Uncharacterized protein n=1 Tax=Rangifer tarandus platyrhynchus TaxID=3082113 RepID=A0ACB1KDP3_RANTA